MSWYCADCRKDMGFDEPNPKCADDEVVADLCEGCGKGWFDNKGVKIWDENCEDVLPEKRGKKK